MMPKLYADAVRAALNDHLTPPAARDLLDRTGIHLPTSRDPLEPSLTLDDFGDLQQAVHRKLGDDRAAALLEDAGARAYDTAIRRRGARPPGLLGVFAVGTGDPATVKFEYYAELLSNMGDISYTVEEDGAAWYWRVRPVPLVSNAIRGRFDLGLVREIDADIIQGDPPEIDILPKDTEGGLVFVLPKP